MKDLDPKTKKARVADLLGLSKALREEYKRRFFGLTMEVLFEDYDENKGIAYGHTSNYLKVAIPADRPMHGTMMDVVYDESVAAD